MARYKHYDYAQMKMLPICFDRQILPGTFEHTLSYLIDEKIDLSVFEGATGTMKAAHRRTTRRFC